MYVLGYRSSALHPKVDERPIHLALHHLAVPVELGGDLGRDGPTGQLPGEGAQASRLSAVPVADADADADADKDLGDAA